MIITICVITCFIGAAFMMDGAHRAQSYYENTDRERHLGTFWRTTVGTFITTLSFMLIVNAGTNQQAYIKALKGQNPYKQVVTRTYDANDSTLISTDTTYVLKNK